MQRDTLLKKEFIKVIFLKRFVYSCFFVLSFNTYVFCQLISLKKEESKKYEFSNIFDPDYGLNIYEKLVFSIGGDSVRRDSRGYNVQGWIEDFYTDGKVLHKGFYTDGYLTVFKNYFPNGQVERLFKVQDNRKCEMSIYYEDGKLKSDIKFFKGHAQKTYEYYSNGALEYLEEYDKECQYYYKRNGFSEDGKPKFSFEITDKKKKLFDKKEFFENGKLKEQGQMVFLSGISDYRKEGVWEYYDETGQLLKKENYHNGELINE